ncbi:GAF domain-containing protein, partial [Rhizobiaceae sp. 2RAB30]
MADYGDFTKTLASGRDEQPAASFGALLRLTIDLVGVKVFTVQTHDHATGVADRLFSTVPEIYPVGGLKPADETIWSRLVIEEQKTFVANDLTEIAAVF